MALTVRQSGYNVKTIYGIAEVSTTTAVFLEVITEADLKAMGAEAIARVRLILLCDDGWLYPSAGVEDLSAIAAAGQAEIEVDDSSIFEAGRCVYLHRVADGQEEWGTILSIDSDTDTLTLSGNLTYAFAVDDDCMDIPNLYARFPLYRGMPLNEAGLNWKGIAIQRRLDANVTVEGYAVVF